MCRSLNCWSLWVKPHFLLAERRSTVRWKGGAGYVISGPPDVSLFTNNKTDKYCSASVMSFCWPFRVVVISRATKWELNIHLIFPKVITEMDVQAFCEPSAWHERGRLLFGLHAAKTSLRASCRSCFAVFYVETHDKRESSIDFGFLFGFCFCCSAEQYDDPVSLNTPTRPLLRLKKHTKKLLRSTSF